MRKNAPNYLRLLPGIAYNWIMSITWKQLRDAREHADLTQLELADMLGVSPRTIVNWEKEGSAVPRKSEYKVIRELGSAFHALRHFQTVSGIPHPADLDEIDYVVPDENGIEVLTTREDYDKYQDHLDREQNIFDSSGRQLARRRSALSPFTDLDLLSELVDRAKDRGVRSSDWTAAGDLVKLFHKTQTGQGGLDPLQ